MFIYSNWGYYCVCMSAAKIYISQNIYLLSVFMTWSLTFCYFSFAIIGMNRKKVLSKPIEPLQSLKEREAIKMNQFTSFGYISFKLVSILLCKLDIQRFYGYLLCKNPIWQFKNFFSENYNHKRYTYVCFPISPSQSLNWQ